MAVSGAVVALLALVGLGIWFGGLFDAPLRPPEQSVTEPEEERRSLSFPDKASVAVLPFANLSASDEHAYIADGLHENITATLSQVRRLFVPARYSTLQYKNADIDVASVARTLGVHHVLEGSVQVAGNSVRITMQLIDAATGGHVWTERYDRPLKDLFALQDEIALNVVTALQVTLVTGPEALRWRGGTQNLEAWALAEKALQLARTYTEENNAEARRLLERALKLDPDYALAWVFLGFTYQNEVDFGWTNDRTLLDQARARAMRALDLDPELPFAHVLMGDIARIEGDVEGAIEWGEKAVALDPNGSNSRAHLSNYLAQNGDPERAKRAVALLDEAMVLSPAYPDWYLWERGRPLLILGRYDEAADAFLEYFKRIPNSPGFLLATVALAKAGRRAEAEAFLESHTKALPDFSIDFVRDTWKTGWTYSDPAVVDNVVCDTLRGLGVPESAPPP